MYNLNPIMKKFLIITIAMLAMTGTVVANENIAIKEYQQITGSENVAERLIAIINDYTKKINAVESVYDLFFISEKCYQDKMSFEKENAEEIATFKNALSQEEQTRYDDAIKKAMNEFEAAVNRKAKIFADEQDATGEKK